MALSNYTFLSSRMFIRKLGQIVDILIHNDVEIICCLVRRNISGRKTCRHLSVERRCERSESKGMVQEGDAVVEQRKPQDSINDQCAASFTCNASSTPRSLGTHMKVAASGAFRGIARDLVIAMGTLSLAVTRFERLTCSFKVRRG